MCYSYTLVGQNIVTSTMDDQIYTVDVESIDRIAVEEGQLIAIHYMEDGGGIPYDHCDDTYSEAGGVLQSEEEFNEYMDVGTSVEFSTPSSRADCRIYSLKAFVGP